MIKQSTKLQYHLVNLSVLATLIVLIIVGYSLYSYNKHVINEHQSTIEGITKSVSYLLDEHDDRSLDWIQEHIALFKTAPNNQIPFTLGNQSYWVLVNIVNKSDNPRSLTLFTDNFILDTFIVYSLNENILEQPKRIYHLNKTNNLTSFYPNTPLNLDAKQQVSYLVKLKSNAAPKIPLLMAEDKVFEQLTILTIVISTVFVSTIFLMVLYNLIIYFAVKDKVYLFYIGYLISALIVLSSINGFGRYIFPFALHQWFNEFTLIFHYLLAIFLMVFTLYFLQYNVQQRWLFKASITLCVIAIITALVSLYFDHVVQAKIFFSLQPLFYLLSIVLVAKRIKTDFSWARFYILSWVPLLTGALVQSLALLNVIPHNFYTRNAFIFAIIVEIILMAFALAERMKKNENARLHTIRYHNSSGLPRRSNLENTLSQLISNGKQHISVIMIKPEHIERIALYIDDKTNTELFQNLYKNLSLLYSSNDAVITLTNNDEKLSFISNNCLALILDNNSNQEIIDNLVKSTQKVIADNYIINGMRIPLSGIIGIANYPEHGKYPHQLLSNAQLSLNTAEKTPQKWAYFHNQSLRETRGIMKMAVELKQSLENNELELYHQPQIDLKTLRVCSSECLLRWKNSKGDSIPPTVFIPLAEDIGLINNITLWVIKTALTQQKYLIDEYGYNHMVSINISGKDIMREHFFIDVITIIEASEVPADKIIFELTESASFSSNKQTIELIEKLKDIGITISIDDFGTGYSSLSQINKLPFQELKIDRQFVENIGQDQKRKLITKATVEMAKGLGLEVVAEGINSQEDEDILREFGCDIGQGYYYAKPMAFDDYIDWLNRLHNGRITGSLEGEYIPASKG